jgi:acyl-CoA synthetase (AMP-forming)/AMP-acid ligase II
LLRLLQGERVAAAAALPPTPPPSRGVVRPPPDSLTSFVAVFAWHLEHHADVPLLTLLPEEGQVPEPPLTYRDLWRDAQATAAGLRERGIREDDTVAIMLPTGREFFSAFYGCTAGVPVLYRRTPSLETDA